MATAIVWCAVVAMCSLYAQQQKASSLGNVWAKVRENYVGISVKREAADAARIHERAVRSNRLPQVKAQAQNTYGTYNGSAGSFFPLAGLFNVSGTANPLDGSSIAASSFGSTTVQWELFSFGKLRSQNKAASSLTDKSVIEKDAYLLSLKKNLSERYIALLYNIAKLDWVTKNAQRLNNIRTITSGLVIAGIRPSADSLLAASSYLQAMGEHDKWDGFKEAAYIKLLELYGDDSIDYGASEKRFINPPKNNIYEENSIKPGHPVLKVLDKQTNYYTYSAEAQTRASLPSLSLLGGYGFRGTGINSNGGVSGAWKDGFNNAANNFLAGIGITWNITNLHTNQLKGRELKKEAESTRLLHEQYQQAMQADLAASKVKIKQQYQQLQKTRLAVCQSKDAYNMYLARYKSGLISLSELLQIRILLEQAEDAQIEASRAYWMVLVSQANLTADFEFLFNNL